MARKQHSKPAECFEFVWWRREKGPGFRWKPHPKFGSILVGPPNEALRAYEPLVEETGLFLTFAHLDGTEAEFLRFANTHGRLGTYHNIYPDGEPLYEWQRHHRQMRFLAELREETLKVRPHLRDIVRWEENEVVFRFPKFDILQTETSPEWAEFRPRLKSRMGLPLFRPGDLLGPARWFLAHEIDDWFRELENWAKPTATRMVWSEQERRPQFVFGPKSLLGAMVCQFAAALHGSWPFKDCAYCHKFFRLAPGINRANRFTCSITCKQYLHNRRVKLARALHAEGRTIRQIAKELNVKPRGKKTSADMVKSWIDRREPRPD
jgi:hypothetical protein